MVGQRSFPDSGEVVVVAQLKFSTIQIHTQISKIMVVIENFVISRPVSDVS